jgi:high-affinity nickel-transport protein
VINALIILSLGLLLGMRHATDADHIIAVSTIVSRERSLGGAARIGALWGLGHTATIIAVGAPLILFRWTISPTIGMAMEFAVALMLIILGIASLIDVRRAGRPEKVHSHFHQHGDFIHRHPHGHHTESAVNDAHDELAHGHREDDTALARVDRLAARVRAYGVIRPVVVGVIHGLAGSAAIALLVLTTIRTPILAIGYLVIFGLGTILGMMILTTAIAVPVVATGNTSFAGNRSFRVAFALVSISFGIFLAIQNGMPLTRM